MQAASPVAHTQVSTHNQASDRALLLSTPQQQASDVLRRVHHTWHIKLLHALHLPIILPLCCRADVAEEATNVCTVQRSVSEARLAARRPAAGVHAQMAQLRRLQVREKELRQPASVELQAGQCRQACCYLADCRRAKVQLAQLQALKALALCYML